MTKKSRLIILLICAACFLAAAPVLIAYSMGYRVDFETMKISATGGIYVKTSPTADQITIDSKISQKPGIFNNAVFVQSLLPKNHTVLIIKTGYYDYSKTLPVKEKEVTKLESVLLFKKDIIFGTLTDKTLSPFLPSNQQKKFIIKNNNLYYSAAPENASLTATEKNTPVIKNLAAFETSNNNIIWLSTAGVLYQSDPTGKNPVKLALNVLKIDINRIFKILIYGQNIFVNNNGELLLLNKKTENLDSFAPQIKDGKISPDGKSIVYFTGRQIYISVLSDETHKKVLLYKSSENINYLFWMNDNYIIFAAGNKIMISEIDYRGNVNIITLPDAINLIDGKTINIKSPQIFLNQSDNKLYILTQNIVLVSEKLTQ